MDNNLELRNNVIQKMGKTFSFVDIGPAKFLVGMRITKTFGSIHIDQEKHINDMLTEFQMKDCKPTSTLTVKETEKTVATALLYKNRVEFMSLVGSLNYVATISRPDIAFAVGKLAQKMQKPTTDTRSLLSVGHNCFTSLY